MCGSLKGERHTHTHKYIDTQTQTHTHTQTLLLNRLWMFGRASCVSFKLGVGCIQLSDRVHGVYTYAHKQNLERKPWSPRCAWPFDSGAELVCINKTEHLNDSKKKKKKLKNADSNKLFMKLDVRWSMWWSIFFWFYHFIYGRKYKLAKSLLRRCAYKYVNTCGQVFDVDHTTELQPRNHFHCQPSENSSAH